MNKSKYLMIPRIIFEVIQLVNAIGQRYLWVESFCIVQDDDDDDKQQQLLIIWIYFCNSEIFIVGSAGSDANAGIRGKQFNQRRMLQPAGEVNGTQYNTAQHPIQQVLKRSMWNSRMWTFQEANLSRRVLIFTESSVYWSFKADIEREDISSESLVAGLGMS